MFKVIQIFIVILLSFLAGWLFMPRVVEVYNQYSDKKRFLAYLAFALLLLFMFVYFAVGQN